LPFGQAVNEAVEKRVEWPNLSHQTAKDIAIKLLINPVVQAGCSWRVVNGELLSRKASRKVLFSKGSLVLLELQLRSGGA
jgi:hypothetical protein